LQPNLRTLLDEQSLLRPMLEQPKPPPEWQPRFLAQHACLHAAAITQDETPPAACSLEDELFAGLAEESARYMPRGKPHSIVWCLWHMARIEDMTLNLLVAGTPQVFVQGGWQERLNTPFADTGNAMSTEQVTRLSQRVDIPTLRAYRAAVGTRTRQVVRSLQPADLPRKVDPAAIQLLFDQEAVLPEAAGLAEYWSRRTLAGLLLMPASRHLLVHLKEALEIKQKKT
jgi:hypothetical protein